MDKEEYVKMFEFENRYWWYRGLHELVEYNVRRIKGTGKEKEKLHILDAGCGTGRLLELLDKYGTVEGLDYSPEAISLCNRRGLRSVSVADLNDWTPPPDTYDIIVSNDVICTDSIRDDLETAAKFHRALKPGGYLLLNFPAFDVLRRNHDIAVSGKRRYRMKKTVGDYKKLGFHIAAADYRLPLLFIIILIQKFFSGIFGSRGEVTSDLKPLPAPVNGFFLWMNRMDNRVIRAGLQLPFGSSLFLVCRKKEESHEAF